MDPRGPQRLLTPTPERLAALGGGTRAASDAAVAPGASDGAPALRSDDHPRGAADFASAADFERWIDECDRLEPSASVLETQDVVYQGTRPAPLAPIAQDNVLRLTEGNPEFLDPNKVAESAGTTLDMNLFEGLVVSAPDNSPARPGAAESWEVSPDGLTYTFHLRAGLTWSDGKPLTAHDFEYSWKRGLAPELASKSAEQLWFLAGARAYNEGKVKTADGVGVRATDDRTLVVTLAQPTPFFIDLATYTAYMPVPRWTIEQWGDRWTEAGHLVSNGAFRLKAWVERDRIELEKNPTYWDKDHVALAGATFYHSESENKNAMLYATGQIHVARALSPDDARRFIADGRSDLRVAADGCVYYYALRTDRPPFDDARVRRAFDLALDKERLVTSVLGLYQKVATTLVPELVGAFTGYVPPPGPDFNPTEGRALLAEAGYPNGVGLDLEVAYNTSEGHKRIAEYVAGDWAQRLGIRATPANMEWKSLLKKQVSGDFQVIRAGWCPDYPHPLTFLGIFRSASENNYPAYKNPAYDALLDRLAAEPDARRRNVLMCAAEKGLMRDMPIVPMYQYTRTALIRPEVQGYLPQYQDRHPLKWVSLRGQGGH